jgi:hypothetical protein
MDLVILVLTNVPNVLELPLIVPNVLTIPEDQPMFVHVLMVTMMMVTPLFVILVTEFVQPVQMPTLVSLVHLIDFNSQHSAHVHL